MVTWLCVVQFRSNSARNSKIASRSSLGWFEITRPITLWIVPLNVLLPLLMIDDSKRVKAGVNIDWTPMWRDILKPITNERMQNLSFRDWNICLTWKTCFQETLSLRLQLNLRFSLLEFNSKPSSVQMKHLFSSAVLFF